MPGPLSIALAQINPTVGDLEGNAEKIVEHARRARDSGCDLVVFPELCLPGYPAEDLYLRDDFVRANRQVLDRMATRIEGITALVGFAEPVSPAGSAIAANSAAAIAGGRVAATYRKRSLPNYGVFDERRQFVAGEGPVTIAVDGLTVGITICEDCWGADPGIASTLAPGADLIANLSASPYNRGKAAERQSVFSELARSKGVPLALANSVGGQDELVFDGQSVLFSGSGEVLARAPQFNECLLVTGDRSLEPPLGDAEELYRAIVTGLRDYVDKNGFERVGFGISGGIDSALVAVLAVDALGPGRVSAVVMPSPHSGAETQADARELAANLGIELLEMPISGPMDAYSELLGADGTGLAAENLQARIRGNILMALSNSRGWLVLTTGNKSETSVGYSTLYGDMAGGFGPIKDLPKTLVYELARFRNSSGRPIPSSVIERPPTAELRPDQLDTDSLPPYEVLDRILSAYVEADLSPTEIVERGEDAEVVRRVVALVDRAEFKRRQAPPGVRTSPRAFGRDRRLPITNRYRP